MIEMVIFALRRKNMDLLKGRLFELKGIITVLGKDRVGIIAKVCTYLAEHNLNILDISQTIVQDYFNMMMIVDISGASKTLEVIVEELQQIGVEIGVEIKLQHEDIFNIMHRI
jgi:ACT domain-containing protein